MAAVIKRTTARGERVYDVRWGVRDPATGVRRQHSRTFPRRREADEFANGVETDIVRGDWIDPKLGRETFASWWARYRQQRVDLRPSTRVRDDAYARAYLLPAFGALPLAALDHAKIQAWIAELSAAGLAPATVVKARQVLARALRGAVNAGLVRSNAAETVDVPRIEREEMRFLTPDELATLADTIGERYRCLVLVGGWCGLRLGELAGLRRARIDLVRRTIDVAEIITEAGGHLHTGPPKTRAGRRTVPMPQHVAAALQEHTAGMDLNALVFTGERGGALRGAGFRRRVWKPAVRRAGLDPLRPHDLRHTAVAFWIAAGAESLVIARRAGHSSVVSVLDRYGHLLPRTDDPVTDRLDELATASQPIGDATVSAIGVR